MQAETVGKAAEHDYLSATGAQIVWTFVRVERVFEIGESLLPGIELFARFLRAAEARSILTPFDD